MFSPHKPVSIKIKGDWSSVLTIVEQALHDIISYSNDDKEEQQIIGELYIQ